MFVMEFFSGHTAVNIGKSKVVVFGGLVDKQFLGDIFVYDIGTFFLYFSFNYYNFWNTLFQVIDRSYFLPMGEVNFLEFHCSSVDENFHFFTLLSTLMDK